MSGKHKIKIERPILGATLCFVRGPGGMCPKFFLIKDNRLVQPEYAIYSSEFLRYNGSHDRYSNKGVVHSFYEGVINLLPLGRKGLSIKPYSWGPDGVQYGVYQGNTRLSSYAYLGGGTGFNTNSLAYTIVHQNDSSGYIASGYWAGGEHVSDITAVPEYVFNSSMTSCTVTVRKTILYKPAYWKHVGGTPKVKDVVIQTSTLSIVRIGLIDSVPSITDKEIVDRINNYPHHASLSRIVPDTIYSDLMEKYAVPDVNNIENLKDLKQIQKSIPPIVKLLRKRSIKSFSELYLWYKYTYSTTKMDLESYYKFIMTWLKDRTSRSNQLRKHLIYSDFNKVGDNIVFRTTRYTVYSDTYNCGVLKALGLDMSMSNAYDLIPFSFVVDWFINFGKILQELDHREDVAQVGIHSVVITNKCYCYFDPLQDLGILTSILFSQFTRTIENELPPPNLSVSLFNPVRHTTDGLALIFSRKG